MRTSSFRDRIDQTLVGPTARELEILALIGLGLTNDEIGRIILLSPETIKSHVRNLLAKFQARNRAHLVSLAWEQEWLTIHTQELARSLFQQFQFRLKDEPYKKRVGQ